MIFGETCLRDKFARNGFEHLPIKRKFEWNRSFLIQERLCSKTGPGLIQKHADVSPILVIESPSKDGKANLSLARGNKNLYGREERRGPDDFGYNFF